MNYTKKQLYERQTTLKEVGAEGQEKLLNSKVLVVGCGGLGSVVGVYLAASGVGSIHLIDFDNIDQSNLHRQVFYKLKDIGKPKAKILAKHIKSISPFVNITFSGQAITKANAQSELNGYDIVVDCTDSLPTKYLLNDICVMNETALVYGSLYKFDGYVASFNLNQDNQRSANLRDAFPEISSKKIPNCSEIGTLNPIVGIIGLLQANEVIKIITEIGKPLSNQLLIYNSLDNSQLIIKLTKTDRDFIALFEKEPYNDPSCEIQSKELLISSKELKKKLTDENLTILSIIEDDKKKLPFKVDIKIPISNLNIKDLEIDLNKQYVIVCNKGITSYTATKLLKENYPKLNVLSLKKGIESFS